MNKIYRVEDTCLETLTHCSSWDNVNEFIKEYVNSDNICTYISHEVTECDLSLSPSELEVFIYDYSYKLSNADELYIERINNGLCSMRLIEVAYKYKPMYTQHPNHIHREPMMIVLEYNVI